MLTSGTAEQLPLGQIISNIGATSYQRAKHLAKLLLPLSKTQYMMSSTKCFKSFIKHQKVPDSHKIVLFDVMSLFMNIPLDTTIKIILKQIYNNNEITTYITKKEMKELILMVKLMFQQMLFNGFTIRPSVIRNIYCCIRK